MGNDQFAILNLPTIPQRRALTPRPLLYFLWSNDSVN
jgi:hypothetical protein